MPHSERIRKVALFRKSRQRRKEGSKRLFELLDIRATPFHAHLCSCFAACMCVYLNETSVVLAPIVCKDDFGVKGHISASRAFFYHAWACDGIEPLHNLEDFGEHDFTRRMVIERFLGRCHCLFVLSLFTIFLTPSYHTGANTRVQKQRGCLV